MASGLEKIEMPKRGFLTFDGDPKRCPQFIKSFKINMQRVEKDSEKLSYLIQYCKGAAKDAIENSLMLPPDEGYKEAKEILCPLSGVLAQIHTKQCKSFVAKAEPKATPSTSYSQLEPPCTLAVSVDGVRIPGTPVPTIEGVWSTIVIVAVTIVSKSDVITQYYTSLK
ncbi:hypothetical protein ACROYT_G013665 [Oculina patagonica]